MNQMEISKLFSLYKEALLNDIVPFWLNNSVDEKYGGYFNYLDRDGTIYGSDKAVWLQGRETWLFSKLYNEVEKRDIWLNAAENGYKFLSEHCFDHDGRMFFSVTRDGRPLRKRRYYFTECFGIMACVEYAKATGYEQAVDKAKETYRLIVDFYRNPEKLPPKVFPKTRVTKSHAVPMMMLTTSQSIQMIDSNPLYREIIEEAIDEIIEDFIHPEERALLETVGSQGERLDSPHGRCVNPGHSIEDAWFLMKEGRLDNKSSIIDKALDVLDWSLDLGWDEKYGGLFYFIDIESRPSVNIEWDMKLWWPHTEALYALLLAYDLTKTQRYESWYRKVHEWTFNHFPDQKYGEWFGYLHRDGSVSSELKGNMWKGAFHIPRAFLYSAQILERMLNDDSTQTDMDHK